MDITPEHPLSLKRGNEYSKTEPIMGNSSEYAFPSIRIDGPRALDFPEYSLVTFKVKRGEVVARSAARGRPASASVELQLVQVCEVEECDPEDEKVDEVDNPIDKLFAQIDQETEEEKDEE